MKLLVLAIVLAVIASVGGWIYWRKRNKAESALISLVVLLRDPMVLDATVLAKTAGRAWGADLGDGTRESGEGDDGFVAGVGPLNTIVHKNKPYLVNCMPVPYVDDPLQAAEMFRDLRSRRLFLDHQAWFSCDAISVDESAPPEELTLCYAKLAKLVTEFIDDNCLLIFVPQTGQVFPLNDDTRSALASDDPLATLSAAAPTPVIPISDDDAEMQAAVAKAHKSWPDFVAAFEERSGEDFLIKAPISHGDVTEFIWITVTALEGERIYGKLANDPAELGPWKLGSKVSVSLSELNDWGYVDPEGKFRGGFTLSVIMKAAGRP